MSLQDRIGQRERGQAQEDSGPSTRGSALTGTAPAGLRLFQPARYGIVDGEFVEVLGQDNLPGMSPVLWCSDINTGTYVPVPTREVKHFATAGQALQALQNQIGMGYTTKSSIR